MTTDERTMRWRPNSGGQWDFIRDLSRRFVALEGGWMSGKTWAGSRKLLYLHLLNNQTHLVPSACVAPTYGNAMDFAVPALFEGCEEIGLPARWLGGDRKEITFPGYRIAPIKVRTADKPDRITGWEVGAYWGDEVARWKQDRHNPRNDPLTQLKGRLRHKHAEVLQGFYTYTNEGDQTAVYAEFREGRESHALYRARTRENRLAGEFAESMAANLTPEMAEQYLEGGAMSLAGSRAYAMFDHDVHVDDSVQLVDGLPLALTLDYNIRPGMHGLLGQYDPEADEFRVVHELHRGRLTIRDLCMVDLVQVLSRYGDRDFPGDLLVFGDPAGQARSAADGRTDHKVVSEALTAVDLRHRLSIASSDPGVVTRVSAVNVALRDMSGRTHLRIHPRCKRLIEDLQKVRWSEDGTGLDKTQTDLSHASDALAYWVARVRPVRLNTGGTARVTITQGAAPAVGR